jgi:uncharacterized protein YaaR (DUF327 family)
MEIRKEMFLGRMEILKTELVSSKQEITDKADKFEGLLKSGNINQVEKVKTLEQWIQTLEDMKTKLENDVTKDNMDTYKDSVKRFLNYYVDNDLYLKEYRTKEGLFYSKKVQVIKSVDEKIDDLTDKLMVTQAGKLEVLRLTGEIQGLLFELIV